MQSVFGASAKEARLASAPPTGAKDVDRVTLRPEDQLDRKLHAAVAAMTSGASPWAALQAWEDWAFHLSISPMRTLSLGLDALNAAARVAAYAFERRARG